MLPLTDFGSKLFFKLHASELQSVCGGGMEVSIFAFCLEPAGQLTVINDAYGF